MVGKKSKVELPEGWIESLNTTSGRKVKIYTNVETGKRLYAKTEVIRYVNRSSITQESPQQPAQWSSPQQPTPLQQVQWSTPEQPSQQESLTTEGEANNRTVPTNEILDGLPSGWRMEVKSCKSGAHKGREYKSYVDPSTGRKFYSKPEVLQYLNSVEHGDMAFNRKKRKRGPKNSSSGKPNEPVDGSPSKQKPDDSISKEMNTADATPAELTERTDASLDNANRTPGWLPSGWKMEFKTKKKGNKYKCFIDPTTGFKFYSKPEVLMFLNGGERVAWSRKKKNFSHQKLTKKRDVNQVSRDNFAEELEGTPSRETTNSKRLASKQKQKAFNKDLGKNVIIERSTPDKLPSGWIKEIKIQTDGNNIRKDPYYTDPVSGYVFRSQTDALRYLETGDINICAIRPKKRDELYWLSGDINCHVNQVAGDKSAEELKSLSCLETTNSTNSESLAQKRETFVKKLGRNIVIERGIPDKLPSGWIKEIKVQMKGNNIRKDPYYTDPVSGYVFRSQTDALRYLETGDINICAIRPKKRDELDWLSGDINSSSAADSQKSQVEDTKRKLFEGKQASLSGSLETKSNMRSTRQRLLRSSKNEEETPEGNLEETPKKDPHPKSMSSGITEATTELPAVDGNRRRGRKKAYTGTMKRKTNLPCRSSRRLSASKTGTIEEEDEPVQTEPETNSVKPSLAETLNEALGIEEEEVVVEAAAVENNPNPSPNLPIKETYNKGVENNNNQEQEQQQQEVDLYHQLGGSSSISISSSWPEMTKEPTWLMNPHPLDFSFKTTLGSNTNEQGPVVQDYFQQEADAANKKADLGAPGFTSFNFFQGNAAAPAPYNFLQTSPSISISSQSPPANPLFYSGIMPPPHQSPQNLMFPPASNNSQNHQSPAHPMFPHGGFGFGFQ